PELEWLIGVSDVDYVTMEQELGAWQLQILFGAVDHTVPSTLQDESVRPSIWLRKGASTFSV
ncbi:unnamed protein product, partial [Rhizoctonia solani]